VKGAGRRGAAREGREGRHFTHAGSRKEWGSNGSTAGKAAQWCLSISCELSPESLQMPACGLLWHSSCPQWLSRHPPEGRGGRREGREERRGRREARTITGARAAPLQRAIPGTRFTTAPATRRHYTCRPLQEDQLACRMPVSLASLLTWAA